MSKKVRLQLIKSIEKKRGSTVISYITGDKPNFSTKIADDVTPLFYRQLEKLGKTKQIDIFLYSRGGNVNTPWRLINLLREFAERITVLIPYRAHSAATLLSLGADEIIMGSLGELSPVDPSVVTPFNPKMQKGGHQQPIPIGVEDVLSYYRLAKEKMAIKNEDNMIEVFKKLTDQVNPIALGRINRSHSQIKKMAEKLLEIGGYSDNSKKEEIIKLLTEKLFSHEHLICRKEALEYGLKVEYSESKKAKEIGPELHSLYSEYEKWLQLNEVLNPKKIMKRRKTERLITLPRALIESHKMISRLSSRIKIIPVEQNDVVNYNVNVEDLGWEEKNY